MAVVRGGGNAGEEVIGEGGEEGNGVTGGGGDCDMAGQVDFQAIGC